MPTMIQTVCEPSVLIGAAGSSISMVLVGGIVVILALIIAMGVAVAIHLRKRSAHSPASLFQQLCRAHQLTGSEKALLKTFVQVLKLSQPAIVFLNVRIWGEVDSQEPNGLTEKQKAGLVKLRAMLFTPGSSKNRARPEGATI